MTTHVAMLRIFLLWQMRKSIKEVILIHFRDEKLKRVRKVQREVGVQGERIKGHP
jgi:hypothetical protein